MPAAPRFHITADSTADNTGPAAAGGARSASVTRLDGASAPPDDYYAHNLQQLLRFVHWRYNRVLDAPTLDFIDTVISLPADPCRLLARLASRKGPAFRVDGLRYAEVSDLSAAIDTLCQCGLLERQAPIAAEQLLKLVRLPELRDWFSELARQPKAQAVHSLLHRYTDQALRQQLAGHCTWLTVRCLPVLQRVLRLYFGDRHQDLSAFVMEDLGLVRYPQYQLSAPDWLTDNNASLARHEALHDYVSHSHALHRADGQCALAKELVTRLTALRLSREQAQLRDRALLRIGHYLERQQLLPDALTAYQGANRHPARERRVRIHTKAGEEAAAQALLGQIRAAPLCASEADFAQRFGQRLKATHPQTQLCLLGPTPSAIEACAAQLLLCDGGKAWHVENRLPLGIAGLLYWDVVYANLPGMFTRPFQMAPNDLFWPDFAEVRAQHLQALERRWYSNGRVDEHACAAQLRATIAQHQSTANPLVNWQLFDAEFVELLLTHIPVPILARLGYCMIRQLGHYRTGFPDLLLCYPSGSYEFVEVKGPNDQLQGGQRRWLDLLLSLSIPARVLKLRADTS